MSKISGKNTKPELKLRSALHKKGFRYRLHSKNLPGKPDLCFPKYKTVIFINGCYWHRHDCKKGRSMPSSNIEFWQKKFETNVERDIKNISELERQGWNVIIAWECELKNIQRVVDTITERLKHARIYIK